MSLSKSTCVFSYVPVHVYWHQPVNFVACKNLLSLQNLIHTAKKQDTNVHVAHLEILLKD